jgi:hypothetical protein
MKRGRQSAAELSINPTGSAHQRLAPPVDLTATEAKLFRELVACCVPNHFVRSDLPLLVSYVQATLLSRRAASALAKNAAMISVWEKATRMQATLATRLRLAPQARTDPKTIARRLAGHSPSAYEFWRNPDE